MEKTLLKDVYPTPHSARGMDGSTCQSITRSIHVFSLKSQIKKETSPQI